MNNVLLIHFCTRHLKESAFNKHLYTQAAFLKVANDVPMDL